MRPLICVFVLLSKFGVSEGTSSYHKRNMREMRETQKRVNSEISQIGADSVPYWYVMCSNGIGACKEPAVGGKNHKSKMIFRTKKCDNRFWEWSDCEVKCFRDNLTPGDLWNDCIPFSENLLLETVFTGAVITAFVLAFRM